MAKKLVALIFAMCLLFPFGSQVAFAQAGDNGVQPMVAYCTNCGIGTLITYQVTSAYEPFNPLVIRDCIHGHPGEADIYYYRLLGDYKKCNYCGAETPITWRSTQYKWICQY